MTTKKRRRNASEKHLKAWTLICLIVACGVALLLRGVVVYELYPIDHKDEIKTYSTEYQLDPYFVCAVITAESGFQENAVSGKGAVGLMQIMPDTGVWAADKIGIADFDQEMLLESESNIRIGCWYLHYLSVEFNGDVDKVLAAYNAGPARVREWLGDEEVLTDIPYEETENYLEKVKRNYEIYKGLYDEF